MRHDVVANVISQMTSNLATNAAQRLSNIVAEELNDKFITELCPTEQKNAYDGESSLR